MVLIGSLRVAFALAGLAHAWFTRNSVDAPPAEDDGSGVAAAPADSGGPEGRDPDVFADDTWMRLCRCCEKNAISDAASNVNDKNLRVIAPVQYVRFFPVDLAVSAVAGNRPAI
ncbi:hypothetical protein FVF58_33675 [Paraburkholderia panacisoli]|uniref:Uncharacterized protein n=1 Tax=Paraburkholderia panacisoli TaxID=2603818 RepID=A0A5B0GKV7_9BURK|nr:hypothetical protein [Paraburkholderia panacisoli]KAA1004084.1 hypothetical protein FVF58_33675 [Paraburkholderia panacisoli]